MGKVILGLAAPHNPNITSRPEKISPEVQNSLDTAFGQLRRHLSEASPDCLRILTSDHVTNFFYNNAPMFCLGVSSLKEVNINRPRELVFSSPPTG